MNVADSMLISGWTSLTYASASGYLPVVKHLLTSKANIDAKDNKGTKIFAS